MPIAAEEAIPTASLNSFPTGTGNTAFMLGGILDNRPENANYRLLADLEIILGGTFTAAANTSPYVNVWLIPAMDEVNYLTTGGGIIAGPTQPTGFAGIITPPAGAVVKVMQLRQIVLPPFLFKVMLNNQLGTAWPASGNTCKLYRYGAAG